MKRRGGRDFSDEYEWDEQFCYKSPQSSESEISESDSEETDNWKNKCSHITMEKIVLNYRLMNRLEMSKIMPPKSYFMNIVGILKNNLSILWDMSTFLLLHQFPADM